MHYIIGVYCSHAKLAEDAREERLPASNTSCQCDTHIILPLLPQERPQPAAHRLQERLR